MGETEVQTTASMLLDALENTQSTCGDCLQFQILLSERIKEVRSAEAMMRATEENSQEERTWARRISQRVRLEAATSRRFILHLITSHGCWYTK